MNGNKKYFIQVRGIKLHYYKKQYPLYYDKTQQ